MSTRLEPSFRTASQPSPLRLLKLLPWLGLAGGVGTALALWTLIERELEPDTLVARYCSNASRFSRLPNGLEVHYRLEGPLQRQREGSIEEHDDRPTLLLIHGWQASLHTWEPWVRALADDFRILSFDLPGHGLTGPTPDDVYGIEVLVQTTVQLLDALGIQRCHVAGSSLGGQVAWELAGQYPERIERLVLINAAGYPHQGFHNVTKLARTHLFAPLRWYCPRWLVRSALQQAYHRHREFVDQKMIDRHHDLIRRRGNRRANLRLLTAPYAHETTPERIRAVRAPTLILWGGRDPWISLRDARRFEADIADSTLRVYPDVGHLPMEEAAQTSARDTRTFLHGSPLT